MTSPPARIWLPLLLVTTVHAQDRVLWRDPGAVERVDFALPAGGAENQPRPPFHFLSEDLSGTNPKILVRDAAAVVWRMKGGPEVRSESFSTRLVSALGYYAEPCAFVAKGKVNGMKPLTRAKHLIHADGSFGDTAFERRDERLRYLNQDWTWNHNPFYGTRELRGLKVLMMLLSNWDNKDARNRHIGSNTGILHERVNGRVRFIFFVNDWGQTLGSWGTAMQSKGWDCAAFTAQTPSFVTGVEGDRIRFGFAGLHTDDFKDDVTVADVRWLLGYLERVTDAQIRRGLMASGGSRAEANCFTAALRKRIRQLQNASGAGVEVTRR